MRISLIWKKRRMTRFMPLIRSTHWFRGVSSGFAILLGVLAFPSEVLAGRKFINVNPSDLQFGAIRNGYVSLQLRSGSFFSAAAEAGNATILNCDDDGQPLLISPQADNRIVATLLASRTSSRIGLGWTDEDAPDFATRNCAVEEVHFLLGAP